MKKLTRNPDEKWIGGVCAGIADYTGVDLTVIRLLVAVGTVISIGTGICAYIVAWILIPERSNVIPGWSQPADPPTTTNEPRPPMQ